MLAKKGHVLSQYAFTKYLCFHSNSRQLPSLAWIVTYVHYPALDKKRLISERLTATLWYSWSLDLLKYNSQKKLKRVERIKINYVRQEEQVRRYCKMNFYHPKFIKILLRPNTWANHTTLMCLY